MNLGFRVYLYPQTLPTIRLGPLNYRVQLALKTVGFLYPGRAYFCSEVRWGGVGLAVENLH